MALPPKAEKLENRLLGPAKKKAEPPSAKTVHEECGCELDDESFGKEAVDKAYSEAEEAFRTRYKISDEEWRIFTKGTEQEVREFQDRLHREILPKENETEVDHGNEGQHTVRRASMHKCLQRRRQSLWHPSGAWRDRAAGREHDDHHDLVCAGHKCSELAGSADLIE